MDLRPSLCFAIVVCSLLTLSEGNPNEDVIVQCLEDGMKLKLMSRYPFYGRIYSHAKPSSCELYGDGEKEAFITLSFSNGDCGVLEEEKDVFTAIVIIQHHPLVQQQGDRALRLACDFRTTNYTVSSQFNAVVDHVRSGSIINSTAPSPHVQFRIMDKGGRDVTDTKLGQDLTLRIEMEENSIFGLAPRGLIASSGVGDEHIELLDENGCPIDDVIFAGLQTNQGTKTLQGRFQAFKFSDDVIVRFHMNVQFCVKECPTLVCEVKTTPIPRSSRQKRQTGKWNTAPKLLAMTDPLLPLQREIIVDGATVTNIPYPPTKNSIAIKETDEFLCLTKTVFIVITVLVVILQICVIITCVVCIWVSKRYQNSDNDSINSDNILIEPHSNDAIFYSDGQHTRL